MGKVTNQDQSGAGLLRDADTGEGLDSMMAVGKPPWHYAYNEDLVRLLEANTTVTSTEVNKIAGLDWNVYQVPAFIPLGRTPDLNEHGIVTNMDSARFKVVGSRQEKGGEWLPDYYCNVRDDLHRVIGVVKKRYYIFQNVEAPVFLDSLVDSGEGCYETAGSLFGGSQVWWLMKLPEGVTIAGQESEKLETFLLLTNSHDGSSSRVVAIVTVRVVCQNTLSYALNKAIRSIKIKHVKGAAEKVAEARRALDIGFSYQAELAELGDQMLHTAFSEAEFEKFLESLLPTPEPKKGIITVPGETKGAPRRQVEGIINQRGITNAINTKGQITTLYFNNDTQKPIVGTLWGAVQAVQFYSDHCAVSRQTEASPEENRFRRLTSGDTLGAQAFAKALTLV